MNKGAQYVTSFRKLTIHINERWKAPYGTFIHIDFGDQKYENFHFNYHIRNKMCNDLCSQIPIPYSFPLTCKSDITNIKSSEVTYN